MNSTYILYTLFNYNEINSVPIKDTLKIKRHIYFYDQPLNTSDVLVVNLIFLSRCNVDLSFLISQLGEMIALHFK